MTRSTIRKLRHEVWELLKYIWPTSIRGQIIFGTGDPATTGQIIGGISMLPLVYKKGLAIRPDFEEQCLRGEGTAKGRIRLVYLVRVAIRLYFDKEVRRTWKRFQKVKSGWG